MIVVVARERTVSPGGAFPHQHRSRSIVTGVCMPALWNAIALEGHQCVGRVEDIRVAAMMMFRVLTSGVSWRCHTPGRSTIHSAW
jgi:hypothetical protein